LPCRRRCSVHPDRSAHGLIPPGYPTEVKIMRYSTSNPLRAIQSCVYRRHQRLPRSLPSGLSWVIVDTLNVWEEKLPDFGPGGHRGEVQRRQQRTDGPGETAVWEQNPGVSVRFSKRTGSCSACHVELRLPLQAQALIDLAVSGTCSLPMTARSNGPLLKPRAFVVYARGGPTRKTRRPPAPGSTIRKDTSSSG